MIPQDLHYLYPQALYFIPFAAVILLLYGLLYAYKQRKLANYGTHFQGERSGVFTFRVLALAIAWILACIAWMQPEGNGKDLPSTGKKRDPHDVVFLIDASASMGIKDGRNGISRLEEAKEIANQILFRLDGQQAAVFAFTGSPIQLSPPTYDLFYVRTMIDHIALREGGSSSTNFLALFQALHDKFIRSPKSLSQTFILISDGEDGESTPISKLAALIKGKDTRLFTIGVGTLEGREVPNVQQKVISKVQPDVLRSLAENAHGNYYAAQELSIQDIAEEITRQIYIDNPYSTEAKTSGLWVYQPYFQVPLIAAIIFLLISLLLPYRLRFFPAMLLMSVTLSAQSDQLNRAKDWYEAGNGKRALDIYREMVAGSLSDWEEMVVRYNIGTVLTGEKKWSDGIAAFQSLPITKNSSPLLERLKYTNMATGRLLEAVAMEDLPKKVYLLRRVLTDIGQAKHWDCELKKIIGYETCTTPYDLEQVQAVAENHLSDALLHLQRYRIEHAGFLTGIPLLLSQVEVMQENLNFITNRIDDPELEKAYVHLFAYEAESWLPLWEQLRSRVDPPVLFLAARKNYLYSQLLFKEQDYSEAQAYLKETSKQLKELMAQEFSGTEEMELLRNLQSSYQHVLLQEPIQLLSLTSLLREQQQVGRIIGKPMDASTQVLKQALISYGEGKNQEARLQLEVSFDAIRVLLKQMTTQASTVNILEDAIEAQEHALNLARLLDDVEGRDELTNAQKHVLETVDPFIAQVVKEQRIEYEELGLCTEEPWNEVVISYYKGLQAARTALSADQPIEWQEQALAFWHEALEELKKEPSPEQNVDQKINPLLQELQQMQQMDDIPRDQELQTIEETKPW